MFLRARAASEENERTKGRVSEHQSPIGSDDPESARAADSDTHTGVAVGEFWDNQLAEVRGEPDQTLLLDDENDIIMTVQQASEPPGSA